MAPSQVHVFYTGLYQEKHEKIFLSKIVSGYDQEIPQSQTADQPMTRGGGGEPHNHHETPGRQTK